MTELSEDDIWGDSSAGPSNDYPTPHIPTPHNAARTGGFWSKKLAWVGVAVAGLMVMLTLLGISGATRSEETAQADVSDLTKRTYWELDPLHRQSSTTSAPSPSAPSPSAPTTTPTTTLTTTTTTVPPTTYAATTAPPTTLTFTVPPQTAGAAAATDPGADAYVAPPSAGGSDSSGAGAAVYYGSCAAARDAGAAPLYRGEPGYRSKLDRDNDGKACE